TMAIPGPDDRERHWTAALGRPPEATIVAQQRMTGGNIRRTATLARASAALRGSGEPNADDVRLAARALHGQLLDGLAERLPAVDGWDRLALPPETRRELELLERRCQERERLGELGGPALRGQLGPGVRA